MQHYKKQTWLILTILLLLPLVSMTLIPFYDTTEPRYAEIARIMVQTNDWITPWFSPGVPFWGKPPLSFWAQAFSMKLFGFNEFAARLPSWICLILSNAIILVGLQQIRNKNIALASCIIYSSSTLVYIGFGAVLTDSFLSLGTTLSMVAFAVVIQANMNSSTELKHHLFWWQYGFFIGIVIGLLAKGPLAVVLIFVPVSIFYLIKHKQIKIRKILPWGKGFAFVAVLSLPWYVLAEIKTPGFIDYFIVGEHLRRFLDPGWVGDLYGTAHQHGLGTIWFYWLQASFPWGLLALITLVSATRSPRLRQAIKATSKDPLASFWFACALFTPLFFTFSANILWTYVLPSLAGFSVLLAIFINEILSRFNLSVRKIVPVVAVVPTVMLILSSAAYIDPDLRNTERGLVSYALQHSKVATQLFYWDKPPFSAQFYSAGQVQEITAEKLQQLINSGKNFYLAVPKDKQDMAAKILGSKFVVLYTDKRYVLVKV